MISSFYPALTLEEENKTKQNLPQKQALAALGIFEEIRFSINTALFSLS
jgi:hypothetical protein